MVPLVWLPCLQLRAGSTIERDVAAKRVVSQAPSEEEKEQRSRVRQSAQQERTAYKAEGGAANGWTFLPPRAAPFQPIPLL